MSLPPPALLFDVYRHMPFLVIHVTTDGIVLHCNPETLRVTGFAEAELVGRNLWATLFPGKLFAQVPRFISLLEPAAMLKDTPMTIRTKSGAERVIALSRYVHTDISHASEGDVAPRSFICIGVDLTDRLLDAERDKLPPPTAGVGNPVAGAGEASGATGVGGRDGAGGSGSGFGPHIGNAGAIDSETVTPIAISPRPPGGAGPCPIEQVREGLARVETHIHCIIGAFDQGEGHMLGQLKGVMTTGGSAGLPAGTSAQDELKCRLLALEDEKHLRACAQSLGTIQARVDELLALHRPELP